MTTLAKTLAEIRMRIGKATKRGLNEQNTKATLIAPVLRALGWDTEDIDEVVLEYKVKRRDKPVDYGLLVMRTPRLFVEAKALGENLNDRKWTNQIMGYAAVAGVKWIVLTDGNEYRIYNAHAPVHVDDKLFRSVRIDSNDASLVSTLALLAKDQLAENRIEELWRSQFIDRQVHAALDQLFADEAEPLLVNYVAGKTESLSADEIRASLLRCRAGFDFPEPVSPPPPPPTTEGSLADLIRAGLIHAPVEVEHAYKGRRLTARIEADGQMTFGGNKYTSPSMAAAMARATVIGMPKNGQPPPTNGWTFWRLRSQQDGAVVDLSALRDKLASGGENAGYKAVG